MPIYEYKCEDCGCEFEVKQGMDEKPLSECKECSGTVHRLISYTSFTLKGSGWYADGYAGKSPAKGDGVSSKGNGNGNKDQKVEKEKKIKKEKKTETSCSSTPETKTLGKD